MEKLNGTSMDIVQDNIEKLKQIFPEVFSENKIDFKTLQQLLGKEIDVEQERYSFNWHGKSNARRIAQEQSTGTLLPSKEDSKNWDNTDNLYIEGDNLEVLKLLQKSYHNKVKMIYIDPPYNTGKDFVYPDNFKDNLKNYLEITGQIGEEGQKLSTNSDSSGRYHSDWLNMMYPRLKLARNLLTDDGVIFISIGEQENHNLRKICDEIFGEYNFIGNAGRISKKANNQGDYWAPNFDYLLTYCKNRDFCTPFFGGINYKSYNLVEEEGDRKGELYQLVRLYMTSLDPLRGCTNQRYFIKCPDGSCVIPPGENFPEKKEDGASIVPQTSTDKVWRWSLKSYLENKEKIVIKKVRSSNLVNENGEQTYWNVFTKTYLNDVINKSTATPNNFIEDHINQKASHELNNLKIPFDFAKPSSLIKFLCQTCKVEKNDIILDFFSGSATTAHATMQLNAEDGGNRKYIMVQLPEPTPENSEAAKAGYKNICEIGKERIRRAGEKIKSDESLPAENREKLDTGFKVFKLDTSNIKEWDSETTDLKQSLFDSVDNIKEDRTSLDVLYEILLKYGLDLNVPIVENKDFYSIGGGTLLVNLNKKITLDVIDSICEEYKNLLEIDEDYKTVVVLRDSSFHNDIDKTNAIQKLKQAGIKEIRSI